jgi:nucleoside-diphosphate-sugar epimerase
MGYILVTGGNGFIGSKLINYISSVSDEERNRILLLTSQPSIEYHYVLHKNYQFASNDFLNKGYDQIDVVIHAGAFTPKSSVEANLYDENYSNIVNTYHLLHQLPNIPDKIIFVSTLDVYQKTTEIIDENSVLNPSGFYGVCKLFCERMVELWCKQNNCTPQILRLGHIYGEGEEAYKKLIPEAIRNIQQNKNPVIQSAGNEKRSYLHVSDCIKAIYNSLNLQDYIGPVNIVSKNAYAIKDIIQILIEVSGKDLTAQILNKEIPVWDIIFDNQKMEKYLGVEQKNFAEGLKQEFYNFKNTN